MGADVARAPDDRALDEGASADVGRGVDDRAHRAGALEERDARREDGVRADVRVAGDPAVVRDERGPLDLVEVVELHPLPQPDVPAQADARNRQLHVPFERVEVRLPVLVEVADVLPVALHRQPVERPPHLQEERKELLREVEGPVGRNVLEHLGLEDVDAGVDRVGEDLPPRGLLEEALDSAVVVRDHDPELERVLDGLEPDRDRRASLLVELDELPEVEVAQRVARDDEERVVELVGGETHRAGRPERRFLDRVLDVDAEALAVTEVAADRLRQEGDGDDDVLEAVRRGAARRCAPCRACRRSAPSASAGSRSAGEGAFPRRRP